MKPAHRPSPRLRPFPYVEPSLKSCAFRQHRRDSVAGVGRAIGLRVNTALFHARRRRHKTPQSG